MHDADSSVSDFREAAALFLCDSVDAGLACTAFGTIMPPVRHAAARTWQRHCFEHGFAGIDWPVEFGGAGRMFEHNVAWLEECARAHVTPYMNFQGQILAGGAIRRFGTPDQQQRYLRPILRGDELWCQLFSEPETGSDLVSLRTRAEPTHDGWILNGQKVWTSTGHLAQHAILLARTDPDTPGHRGISFFLFDMTVRGVDVHPIKQMTGDIEFCEVFLTDAEVPADALLGPLHGGWGVATSVLSDERATVGAAGIGLRRRVAALTPSTGDRRSNLVARATAAAHLLTRSAGDIALGPLTKLALTELESSLAEFDIDAAGASGMLESALGDAFLYAPGMRVAGGTSEIQRNLIGERLLGLPREPKG